MEEKEDGKEEGDKVGEEGRNEDEKKKKERLV